MSKVFRVPPPVKNPVQQVPLIRVGEGKSNFDEYIASESDFRVETNLMLLAEGARIAALYEMSKIVEEILIDSQDNYVPIDTGDLRESGDCDRYDPEAQTGDLATPKTFRMAVWYAGAIGPGGSLFGRMNTESTVHAGHRMGSRTRRNIRTYGPEHLGFHLQSPQFKEWYNRDPPKYALDQHENLSYKHGLNYSGTGPGQAKYLERPFNAKRSEVAPRIASAINATWTGTPGEWTGD